MQSTTSKHNIIEFIRRLQEIKNKFYPKDSFNIFDAIGFDRQEIKHSKTLAFLLDPNKNHQLGDSLLKELIFAIVEEHPDMITKEYLGNISPPTWSALPLFLDDLNSTSIKTEWYRIDILITSKQHKLVIAIENKVGASESKDQLSTYYDKIRNNKEFKDYKKVFLYLTPSGDPPSAKMRDIWLPIDYQMVVDSLRKASAPPATLNPSSTILINHYIDLLEGKVTMNEDKELSAVLDEILRVHGDLIDQIIQRKKTKREGSYADEIFELLREESSNLTKTDSEYKLNSYIDKTYFRPNTWGFMDGTLSLCIKTYQGNEDEGDKVELTLELDKRPTESQLDKLNTTKKEIKKIHDPETKKNPPRGELTRYDIGRSTEIDPKQAAKKIVSIIESEDFKKILEQVSLFFESQD